MVRYMPNPEVERELPSTFHFALNNLENNKAKGSINPAAIKVFVVLAISSMEDFQRTNIKIQVTDAARIKYMPFLHWMDNSLFSSSNFILITP